MERLTVALPDGSIERLRTLAGGERKIGGYLAPVVAWLWRHKEALHGRPLAEFVPVPAQDAVTARETLQRIEERLRKLEEAVPPIVVDTSYQILEYRPRSVRVLKASQEETQDDA